LDVTSGSHKEQLHTFHIHQLPFQVMSVSGTKKVFTGYVDTVDVEPGSTVVIRLYFNDPNVLGRFVFHCHILKHEDLGMMQVINLVNGTATGAAHSPAASLLLLITALALSLLSILL